MRYETNDDDGIRRRRRFQLISTERERKRLAFCFFSFDIGLLYVYKLWPAAAVTHHTACAASIESDIQTHTHRQRVNKCSDLFAAATERVYKIFKVTGESHARLCILCAHSLRVSSGLFAGFNYKKVRDQGFSHGTGCVKCYSFSRTFY